MSEPPAQQQPPQPPYPRPLRLAGRYVPAVTVLHTGPPPSAAPEQFVPPPPPVTLAIPAQPTYAERPAPVAASVPPGYAAAPLSAQALPPAPTEATWPAPSTFMPEQVRTPKWAASDTPPGPVVAPPAAAPWMAPQPAVYGGATTVMPFPTDLAGPGWGPVGKGPQPSRTWWWLAAGLAVVIAIAGVGWYALADRGGHKASTGGHSAGAPTHGFVDPEANSVITKAGAAAVVAAYWPRHEAALVSQNLGALAALSTGAAQQWEQADVSDGYLPVTGARPLLSANYYVPAQTAYPAFFVAQVGTTYSGHNWVETLVFSKARSSVPWLVEEDSAYSTTAPIAATNVGRSVDDVDGFDAPVAASDRAHAAVVVNDLVALWAQAKSTGVVPSSAVFDVAGELKSRLQIFASLHQDELIDLAHEHWSFAVDTAAPLITVSDYNTGTVLACQPIIETIVFTATPGAALVQNASRSNWGIALPPGRYSVLNDRQVWQTCFYIPATSPFEGGSPADKVAVMDHYYGGPASSVAQGSPSVTATTGASGTPNSGLGT